MRGRGRGLRASTSLKGSSPGVRLNERIQTAEVVAMAAMVPVGMDFCASCRSPERLEPAMMPASAEGSKSEESWHEKAVMAPTRAGREEDGQQDDERGGNVCDDVSLLSVAWFPQPETIPWLAIPVHDVICKQGGGAVITQTLVEGKQENRPRKLPLARPGMP